MIAAAVKPQPFDPAVAVAWAVAAGRQVEAMVARVGALTDVDEIPAYAAPQIEHWAELHTRTERRCSVPDHSHPKVQRSLRLGVAVRSAPARAPDRAAVP